MSKRMPTGVLLIVLVSVLSLFLMVGCQDGSSGKDEQVTIEMVSGAMGAWAHQVASELCRIISEEENNIIASPVVSGGLEENIRLVSNGEAAVGFGLSPWVGDAFKGEDAFASEGPKENLRALFAVDFGAVKFIVDAKSSITTIKDLKGKVVNIGAPGASSVNIAREILKLNGITDKDCTITQLSSSAASDALKDGSVDAIVYFGLDPMGSIQDLAASQKLRFIPCEDSIRNQVIQNIPGVAAREIPIDLYTNIDNDSNVSTVGATFTVVVTTDMTEEVGYEITKSVFENLEEFYEFHAQAKNLRLDNALEGISIPLNEGAFKYFQEKGINIPESLLPLK